MKKDLRVIKKVAIDAAKEAGKYAFKRMGSLLDISFKRGPTDLVTDVDKKCEKKIIKRIRDKFPLHSILAEEGGGDDLNSPYKWIIDPLDGTVNYSHAFPIFCVSIGFLEEGTVKLGVVYDASRDELFVAEKGKGAFLNNKKIKVSKTKKIKDALVSTGFPYNKEAKRKNLALFTNVMENAQAIRRAGSAAIDLCYVACGRFDGFWELELSPWDTAAGILMIEEAGGTITMLKGEKFDIFKKEIVCTNSKIHKEMLSVLAK